MAKFMFHYGLVYYGGSLAQLVEPLIESTKLINIRPG